MGDVFNSFPLRPREVNFSLTERCNAECAMCATDSAPGRRGRECSQDQLLDWIAQAGRLPGCRVVCFTGGEPFLRLAALEAGAEEASARGLAVAAVTNSYWAKSPGQAKKIATQLRRAGVQRLVLSADRFHQRFVPLERVGNALTAARAVGIKCTLNVVEPASSPGSTSEVQMLQSALADYDWLDSVQQFPELPVGRSCAAPPAGDKALPSGRCRIVVSTTSVKPDGRVFACCGVGGFTPPLLIGNLHEKKLDEIVESALEDPLILTLAMKGPSSLAHIAEKRGAWKGGAFVDECHLCHDVLRRKQAVDAIRDEHSGREASIRLSYELRVAHAEERGA